MQGTLLFWKISINCVKNAQLNKCYNKESILALLYGKQRGDISAEFATDSWLESVKIIWHELFCDSNPIQVWGSAPASRNFCKLFKDLTNVDTKTSLFVMMS